MANTIYAIRAHNLRQYLKTSGVTQTALSQRLAMKSGSYLSQVISPAPKRFIREDTAREWERLLNLTPGWLDVERDEFGRERNKGPGGITEQNALPPVSETPKPIPTPAPTQTIETFSLLDLDQVSRIAGCVAGQANQAGVTLSKEKMALIISIILRHPLANSEDERMQALTRQLIDLAN